MSSPTPGNFDCSKLQEVKARANELFTDDVRKAEYMPESDTAQLILNNQTARLEVLKNPEKDYDLKAYWVDDCDDDDPDTCDKECEIDGEQIGDICRNYALTDCIQKSFSITSEQFRTSLLTPEEVVATALNKKLLLMDRMISKSAIAFLDANSGVNAYPGEHTIVGDHTAVNPASMNPDFFGYLARVRAQNKLPQMKVLDSGTLYRSFWKAQMEASNPTGAAELRKMGAFGDPTFDLFQLEPVVGAPVTFLFNPNSVAIATRARFLNASSTYGLGGQNLIAGGFETNWSVVKSPTLKNVWYDLIYQKKCIAGRDIEHVWQLEVDYGVFLNPLGCDNGRTGILQFRCAS